jgi:tetratricopeptide (TPR) repeat protein
MRPGGPALADDIAATDLDKEVRAELLSLARGVADTVARHLVATGRLIDEDPGEALAHALAARRLASRIAVVREAVGLSAYHAGEWQTAIAELRTYHRMSGRQTHLAVLADCERALGRPERAVDLYRNADRGSLAPTDAVELLIVAAGARGDLGQRDAAVTMLQVRELTADEDAPWVARLRYAYADALLAAGRREEAREWFSRAAQVDDEAETDAAERLLELDGVVLEEAADGETDEDEEREEVVDEAGDVSDVDAAPDQPDSEDIDDAHDIEGIDDIEDIDDAEDIDAVDDDTDAKADDDAPVGEDVDEGDEPEEAKPADAANLGPTFSDAPEAYDHDRDGRA